MRITGFKTPCGAKLLFTLASAVLFAAAVPCMGQGRGGAGGGGGMGTPPKPKDPGGDAPLDDRPTGSGSGYVMKYELPKEGADEDVLAYLTYKPEGKSPPVKIRIMREQPVKFDFPEGKEIEPEEYADVLVKGLYCRYSWKVVQPPEGKKVPARLRHRDLTTVSFDGLEISGKIEEIRDDLIIIRGKPTNDNLWPDMDAGNVAPGRGGQAPKPKRVPLKKVKLRIIDGVTKFLDADSKPLDFSELEASHKVEATIVYGRSGGIALSVKSPTLRSESSEEDRSADRRGGRPRPPSPS